MDRRRFLGVAAGSVASAGAIGWLAHYFLSRPTPLPSDAAIARMGDVSAVYREAFALGKPMLVLVIPEDDGRKSDRGEVFGALLNHGSEAAYLDLALSELVCATVATVREELRGVEVTGEPLMLLVETDGPAARALPIDPELRDLPDYDWKNRDEIERIVEERMGVVAGALREALLPDAGSLAARAKLVEARLPAEETGWLRAMLDTGLPIDPLDLDRQAALVRAIAEDPKARRAQVLRALADAAADRVKGRPPVGARWASRGCGLEIEGGPPSGINCGMGYVPYVSQRFLWFFTK